MADAEVFTLSPFRIAWADNNWPDVVCLAGPQVAAASLPSGWVETIGYGCGPDRSRNGGEASASVILLKADGGEVLSRPSGWTYGIECAQRTAVGARILPVRVEIRSTKDCAHLHSDRSDEPSPHISFSPEDDWPTKAFSSLRWCQGHRFIPNSERERRNTAAKARSVFNTGIRCCQPTVQITSLAR